MKIKSKILIIAGSDSSGGRIQADIKAITSLGSYAMTAITAITSQNTTGVKSVLPIHHKEIEKQILFSSKDIAQMQLNWNASLIKSHLVSCKGNKKIKTKKIILDPVMVAKGSQINKSKTIETLKINY